jgi:alpha-L-arabinofuranosidase
MKNKAALFIACLALINFDCGLQLKTMSGESITGEKKQTFESNCTEYWDECVEMVISPPSKPQVKDLVSIITDKLPEKGFAYVYGGKTAYKMQPGSLKKDILVCYMDGNDYSGVTIALGQGNNIDMAGYRQKGTAGIAFWAKGAPGVSSIYLGLIDDGNDNKKIQSKLRMGDFGSLDTNWKYFMIPVRKFSNSGKYWDDNKKTEITSDIDWKNINEIRFSVNKGENRIKSGEPVKLYITDVSIINEIPGYIDAQDYWNAFQSDLPDIVLNDFDTEIDHKWVTAGDPKSTAAYRLIKSTCKEGKGDALEITYSLMNWCDVVYDYRSNNRPKKIRDWTKHWGIKFNVYTERAFQPFSVQIQDASDELFIASAGAERGWSEIIIPFKNFEKFPYYQPPEARQNGVFDLDSIVSIDFKPSGEGTSGTFVIENIRLTNDRVAKKTDVPENVTVSVNGSFNKVVTDKINPGIFGINAVLWDTDLLSDESVARVKEVNHQVIRFPGGLSADQVKWKEVLAKKDHQTDIDEFLEYCRKTGTTPMITVNFGTGTAQEAAELVQYTNIKKNANIKFWEIGNELYGDWHPNHCTAKEYGMRAAEFISAMKKVDPSIKITVVWMLGGDWNKEVFQYTKDLADGVNIHHYPQGTGEENDAGLLSAPQTLDDIIPAIRKQLSQFGNQSQKYEIWLTEWNSVDFRPGPQILSLVNGLFVADYLGMLAKHNIEHASYWNIHNDISENGGDYGYLSRTGSPDGDQVTRPSYWAFLMASKALSRGTLYECAINDMNISGYLTSDNGKKSLMLINKYPKTSATVSINIPGFSGKAVMEQLTAKIANKGPDRSELIIKKGQNLNLPAHTVTTLVLE